MPIHSARLALLLALFAPACGADGDPGDSDGSATTDGATGGDTTSTAATADANGEAASTADEPTTSVASTTSDGDASTTSPASTTGDVDLLPPTDSAEQLEAWLAAGAYLTWPAESQIHASAGPHGGNVRTFVNPALAESLAAADAMHPEGAASVKELYGDGTDEIVGYAVMVKLAPDSGDGDGWYWYERLNATVYADDIGVNLCTGCHGGGSDYVLTPWPLQ
ncbi:hypothetical protein SAMN02745121_00537 [Nannocystis exedens]|uniref:Cytochrome P460 n=1 Tax=Nannocystis exedens TaxID=54 RepID=A0A1I1TE27_9BACT|nr:hypothetical protein [Nannocystis exedens]PCC66732.1 hypothetical protein NAEX_09326 [Nannocystis exedens]SFD54573.1 hypothetical protein SAMN02745121_00537 [Nannocystis exedens]